MQPRIYTYKITFEEIPHWYWGVHKEKKFGELYLGSPVTHKWMWEFYTPRIQILEFFPFTEEGWKEANLVEDRLIKPDLNKPLCLNENYGGYKSIEACKKGGYIGGQIAGPKVVEEKLGVHCPDYVESEKYIKDRVKGGQVSGQNSFEKKTKIFAISREERIEISSEVGRRSYEEEFGMFAPEYKEKKKEWGGLGGKACKEKMSPERQRERAKKMTTEKWMCMVTGYITTKGPLTNVQKPQGIDPRLRVRVDDLLPQQLPIILAGI
jgi:hypothetical protein